MPTPPNEAAIATVCRDYNAEFRSITSQEIWIRQKAGTVRNFSGNMTYDQRLPGYWLCFERTPRE